MKRDHVGIGFHRRWSVVVARVSADGERLSVVRVDNAAVAIAAAVAEAELIVAGTLFALATVSARRAFRLHVATSSPWSSRSSASYALRFILTGVTSSPSRRSADLGTVPSGASAGTSARASSAACFAFLPALAFLPIWSRPSPEVIEEVTIRTGPRGAFIVGVRKPLLSVLSTAAAEAPS
jgi:hypothetical protein